MMELDEFAPVIDKDYALNKLGTYEEVEHPVPSTLGELEEYYAVYLKHSYAVASTEIYHGLPIELEGEYRLCPWLMWKEPKSSFESLFLEPELWTERQGLRLWEDVMAPDHVVDWPRFLELFIPNKRDDKSADYGVKNMYDQLLGTYRKGSTIPNKYIPELGRRRDAFEKQLRTIGRRMKAGPLKNLRSIYRMMLTEKMRNVKVAIRKDDTGRINVEEYCKYHVMYQFRKSMDFVKLEALGVNRENSLSAYDLLCDYDMPNLMIRATRFGIEHCLRERDELLQAAYPLNQKRLVLEGLLYVAMHGKEVPDWEEVEDTISRERGRPRKYDEEFETAAKELLCKIEKRETQKPKEECIKQGDKLKEIQDRLCERFGLDLVNVPSESTIRRYIGWKD